MKLLRLMAVGIALVAGSVASAQQPPVPSVTGPQDPGQMNATFNRLINQINAILLPLLPNTPGAVNFVSLTPATTGNNAVIGLAPGSDTNAGITINPNGSGNIVLFGNYDTGVLQIANASSFIPATGIGACPSVPQGPNKPFGVRGHITGFFKMQDWLGRSRYVLSC